MSHGQIDEQQFNHEREIAERWQYTEEFKAEIEAIMNGEKGLSFSSLKALLESPYSFYKYKTEKKSTKAMTDGIAFHMACLEPDRFEKSYFVLDDEQKVKEIGGGNPRATTLYKTWLAEQMALNVGKPTLSKDDYNTFKMMANYLRYNSATKDIMNSLKYTEKEFSFDYEGLLITGKIDGGNDEYIVDLKKVADASIQKVKWEVRDRLLDLQSAIYTMAERKEKYFLIFIDTDLNVTVVKLCTETIAQGLAKFEGAINGFRSCAETVGGFFQSYEFYNGGYVEL